MKKEKYVYTEKDLFIGLEFTSNGIIYKITDTNPFIFIDTRDNYEFFSYTIKTCLNYFNTNDWKISNSKPQNIELWI